MPEGRQSSEEKNMNAVLIGLLLILLVGGWFVFRVFWKHDSSTTAPEQPIASEEKPEDDSTVITADVVRQKLLNNEPVKFLDLRDQKSYEAEHIPHSLPLSPGALGSFTPEQGVIPVIVLSANDAQVTETVKNLLKQKSYTAFLLKGGFEEWKRGGNQTISAGDPNSFLDQSKITYISPADALKMIGDGNTNPFILDVQSKADYERVHIKGAVNIPLEELEKRSDEVPPGKNILVYGSSSLTSFQGGVRLADLNFFGTRTLQGDNILQLTSGLPLVP